VQGETITSHRSLHCPHWLSSRSAAALWDAGERLPPNEWQPGKPCSIYMKCPCGEIVDSHRLEENLVHVPHISAGRDLR
jgi:hypothetical protein